jgi:thiazole synthase ThiGH ThiG subunit
MNWIKLEVIGNHDTLQPDVNALAKAPMILSNEGFEVFPAEYDRGSRLCRTLAPTATSRETKPGASVPAATRLLSLEPLLAQRLRASSSRAAATIT